MTTKHQLILAWTVAAILAVLLIIALYFVFNPQKDLGTVLEQGTGAVAAQRIKMKTDCQGTDAASKTRCAQDMQDLSTTLQELSNDIKSASTATSTPAASTTK